MRTGLQFLFVCYHGYSNRPNLASLSCRRLHTDALKMRITDRCIVTRFNGEVKIANVIHSNKSYIVMSTPKFGFQYIKSIASYYSYAIRFKGSIYMLSVTESRLVVSTKDIALVQIEFNIPFPESAQQALQQVYDLKLDQFLLITSMCRNSPYKVEVHKDDLAEFIDI